MSGPGENETTWGCIGLALSGSRSLSAEELEALRRVRRTFLRRGWGLALAGPMVFVACATAALLSTDVNVRWTYLLAAIFGGLLLIGILTGLAAQSWLKAARQLAEDLAAGTVQLYGEPGEQSEGGKPYPVRQLERSAGPAWLERLPQSGLLWRIDGRRPSRWMSAERVLLAAPPAYARVAAEWVQPVLEIDEGVVHANDREMAPAERDEIRRFLRRLLPEPTLLFLLAVGWLLIVLVQQQGRHRGETLIGVALPVLLMLITGFRLGRTLVLAQRLGQDVRNGRVVIARLEPVEQPDESTGLSAPEEFLPVSRLAWSIGGKPAPWRPG